MASYCYDAVDAGGLKTTGILDVADQGEALRRIKEMGLFPTRIAAARERRRQQFATTSPGTSAGRSILNFSIGSSRPRQRAVVVFTRQLATLVQAGMPLLRGLRTLEQQTESDALKKIIRQAAAGIESGSPLSEALANHPKVFNDLYVNMVRAGELGGALEITLRRLAEFMEKAQKIKGKVKAAMFYPAAVLFVACAILVVLVVFVVPRFQLVFDGLLNGKGLPPFTAFVFSVSTAAKEHLGLLGLGLGVIAMGILASLRTRAGRRVADRMKLILPVLGPLFRKVAISRFTRTLGTLLNSGVPVLQALTIVRNTAGNVIVGNVIARIHESVKQGESIAVPMKASNLFPPMVGGMVDVGEQTGALPDMLMKIADGYDEEVDNAVSALTSLLEPIMILFLAVVVGSIVIAMFLPLIAIFEDGFDSRADAEV